MKAVCVDTHIIIWGIKEESTSGQEDQVVRAKLLLDELDSKKVPVIIPSVVLAELLMRIPRSEHQQFIHKLEKRFIISPFDGKASSVFGNLWQTKNGVRKDEPECTRDHLKADLMILSIAIAENTKQIFSSDPHIQRAAQGIINCTDIPTNPSQLSLEFDLPANE